MRSLLESKVEGSSSILDCLMETLSCLSRRATHWLQIRYRPTFIEPLVAPHIILVRRYEYWVRTECIGIISLEGPDITTVYC